MWAWTGVVVAVLGLVLILKGLSKKEECAATKWIVAGFGCLMCGAMVVAVMLTSAIEKQLAKQQPATQNTTAESNK